MTTTAAVVVRPVRERRQLVEELLAVPAANKLDAEPALPFAGRRSGARRRAPDGARGEPWAGSRPGPPAALGRAVRCCRS